MTGVGTASTRMAFLLYILAANMRNLLSAGGAPPAALSLELFFQQASSVTILFSRID